MTSRKLPFSYLGLKESCWPVELETFTPGAISTGILFLSAREGDLPVTAGALPGASVLRPQGIRLGKMYWEHAVSAKPFPWKVARTPQLRGTAAAEQRAGRTRGLTPPRKHCPHSQKEEPRHQISVGMLMLRHGKLRKQTFPLQMNPVTENAFRALVLWNESER